MDVATLKPSKVWGLGHMSAHVYQCTGLPRRLAQHARSKNFRTVFYNNTADQHRSRLEQTARHKCFAGSDRFSVYKGSHYPSAFPVELIKSISLVSFCIVHGP